MNVKQYEFIYDDENSGTLQMDIVVDGEEYELTFEFSERITLPSEHSPLPSGNKQIYAWPAEPIPDEIITTDPDRGISRNLNTQDFVPGITLLNKPYDDTEAVRSPFVDQDVVKNV